MFLFPSTLYEDFFVLVGYSSGIFVILYSLGLFWTEDCARRVF